MNPTTISSPKASTGTGHASATNTPTRTVQPRRTSDLFIESPLSVSQPLWDRARYVRNWSRPPPSVRTAPGSRLGDRAGAPPASEAERVTPENALRPKAHHQDDDAAPHLPAPVRQELQRGGEVGDDERAEQRAVQRVHAAEHHVHRDIDAALEIEVVVLDEHGVMRVEAAADAGDERARREGGELGARDVDAHRLGRGLVQLDRVERAAHP